MTAEDAARALRARLPAEQVHTSGPEYESTATVWNAAAVARPAVVVECRSTADVQAAVRAARELGLPLSVRGGGHDWAGRAVADGGITLDLRPFEPRRGRCRAASRCRRRWCAGQRRACRC